MSVAEINDTKPYLTFILGEELFAVDVNKVREVLDLTKITRVPQTPEYMKGVINLRGNVVPVIDFRLKFGMKETEKTIDTCIIVLELKVDDEMIIVGILADSVREVFELDPGQIEAPPKIGTKFNVEYLYGIGKKDDEFLMMLNIDKAFSFDEINFVQEISDTNLNENVGKDS